MGRVAMARVTVGGVLGIGFVVGWQDGFGGVCCGRWRLWAWTGAAYGIEAWRVGLVGGSAGVGLGLATVRPLMPVYAQLVCGSDLTIGIRGSWLLFYEGLSQTSVTNFSDSYLHCVIYVR
jgi:hypothetical protein